jgi:hypothetical protein
VFYEERDFMRAPKSLESEGGILNNQTPKFIIYKLQTLSSSVPATRKFSTPFPRSLSAADKPLAGGGRVFGGDKILDIEID